LSEASEPRTLPPRVRGVVHLARLDLAVLLVTIPHWTRLNRFAIAPDQRGQQRLTEELIVQGYLRRLRTI
jgi:hypothetical protein